MKLQHDVISIQRVMSTTVAYMKLLNFRKSVNPILTTKLTYCPVVPAQ